jgi:hypothetical protein
MSIRDIKELFQRGVLRLINGRPSYPHPWEVPFHPFKASDEIEKRTGNTLVTLAPIEGWGSCPKCGIPYPGPPKPEKQLWSYPSMNKCLYCGEPRA